MEEGTGAPHREGGGSGEAPPGPAKGGLEGIVRCPGCSATYEATKSGRRSFKCSACRQIVDTDPWRRIMRAMC